MILAILLAGTELNQAILLAGSELNLAIPLDGTELNQAKIRVSQVFWEPIKNCASPRSALLDAVYLKAVLYHLNKYLKKMQVHEEECSFRYNFVPLHTHPSLLILTCQKIGHHC